MSHSDEARYGKACLLLLNVCPFTLRKVIDDFYTRNSHPNLQNFLDDQTRKHDLFHLLSKSCCCGPWQDRVTPIYRSQWNLLYDKKIPPSHRGYSGDCPCKYNAKPGITCKVMDISLCCLILTNICSGPPGINMTHIETIRNIRNKLIHAMSASLDEITFKDYWMKIEIAIYDLAKNVSPTVLTDTQKMVKELETRVMNYGELGELRKIMVDMKKFAELEEKLLELYRDHGNTRKTVTQIESNINKMTERMTQIEGEKKEMEGRVDQKVAQVEGNVNKMTERMTQMEGEKKEMEGRVDQKVAQVEGNINKMTERMTQMEGEKKEMERRVDQKVAQVEGNINKMTERMTQMEGEKKEMEGRVDQKVAQVEGNINKMTERMTQIEGEKKEMKGRVDQKVAQMEGNVNKMTERMTQMEGEKKEMDRNMDGRMTQMAGGVNQIEGKILNLEDVDKQGQEIKQMKARTDFPRGEGPDIGQLRRKLFDINDYKTKVIPISPLQGERDEEMTIEALYASVVICEDPKYATEGNESSQHTTTDPDGKSNKQQTREVTNPDDIFKKDGKVARNIYMLGDAAHGKTTYCMWLLKKWCNAQQRVGMESKALDKWEKALLEFDFVFLLQFRYVNPSRASVIDMICQDVFRRDKGYHVAIRHVLSSDDYRSLIIMDGLDEWNPKEDTKDQLTYEGIPNIEHMASTVSCFISMRPSVFPTISNLVEVSDRVIEILGLSDTGMEQVIENVLLNHYKLKDDRSKYRAAYDKIVRHFREKNLNSFMKIPLLAVVCVQIWYKGKQVGDSMASFYAVMVDMLIERADQKHRKKSKSKTGSYKLQIEHNKTGGCKLPQILSEKENIANYFSVLLKLGKVAYEGLLSKETNLVFQKRKLEQEISERELQFLLDVGLISQKEAPSLITKYVSVHFFHESIQEFLAVIYIVAKKEVSDSFCEHLSNVKVIMELSNVIMFICGMCPSLGCVISQSVVSVTDGDTEICKYRESSDYDSTVEELYKLQVRWYRELQYGETDSLVTQTSSQVTQTDSLVTQTDSPVTQTDNPVTQTGRPVTFHVSDVYLDSYSDTETLRVTRELLSDHHVDIRSLWLRYIPTDGERGITNAVLDDLLSNTYRTKSLVMLYINGCTTGRSLPTLCVPTLRCLRLDTVKLTTHLCGNVCPPLLTDMSHLHVLELSYVTLGQGGLGLFPDMVHIERIELWGITLGARGLVLSPDMVHIERVVLVSVNMPAAGWGEFVRSVSQIQHRFNVVLWNINIDDVSVKMIRSSPDFTITRDGVDKFGRYRLRFTTYT